MIIGLEWLIIGFLILALSCIITMILCNIKSEKLTAFILLMCTLSLVFSGILHMSIIEGQKEVKTQYYSYVTLQLRAYNYNDLSVLEKYELTTDIMKYNLWYEKNKSNLQNIWTVKGTCELARELNYVIIQE